MEEVKKKVYLEIIVRQLLDGASNNARAGCLVAGRFAPMVGGGAPIV